MHEGPSTSPLDANPLVKDVAGHLFTFEEKIFGMSLTQLLTDLGVLTGSFACMGALALLPRVLVCLLITLIGMALVHGKMHGMSLGFWLCLLLRAKLLPRTALWRSQTVSTATSQDPHDDRFPSIQARWVPLETLAQGIGGTHEQKKKHEITRYWMAFEVEGKNIRLLPESEQVRVFRRFETFLTGLEFHLQFISQTEQIDPQTSPALVAQKEALALLDATPQIQAFQRLSIQAQEQQIATCSRTRHFIIVSASGAEAAFRSPDGATHSVLSSLWQLLPFHKTPEVTQAQVLDQLHTRSSVLRKAMQRMDLRIWPLDDQEQLRLFACCLAPGSPTPTFVPALVAVPLATSDLQKVSGAKQESQANRYPPDQAPSLSAPMSVGQQAACPTLQRGAPDHTKEKLKKRYKKQVNGVHGAFYYTSQQKQARFETGILAVADLVSPSRIDVCPDVVQIQAGKQTRYTRMLMVTGYGHHLVCGWVNTLHDLGVPLLVSSHFEPIDSRLMLMKLEQALTKVESKRLSDQKQLRLTKADHQIEAEQIRLVTRALASKKLKIFAVSMTICLHAGSRERLDQRTQYVFSHLRDMQIQARSALYQQDSAWQSCLPVGLDLLQQWVNLTSDVVSTMLPGTSGTVGTPTGLLLGYTGSGLARRPVYLDPWSTDKKMANPHIVIIGETGQGKSWLGKIIATGFMGLGLADVVVLDKDDDFVPLHEAMPGESQRYNLARSCPINLFDIPFGPADVDPDDPADILAEFFDTSLITGLTLLVADEGTPLTKSEEAYLIAVARVTYAEKGMTGDAIRRNPDILLLPVPTLADFMAKMQTMTTAQEALRQSLLERLEKASYLFQAGQTSISLEKPLTVFSIKEVDQKWVALMTYVVQNFLMRHRALRQDDRYLAYIVEEASYLLKHPAGRRYLENGSRGFRKLGIAQITLSQHPRDFLEDGQVVLSNAGTVFYLGMQQTTVEKLHLSEELERILVESVPGQCVLRIGNEYAPLTIWSPPVYRTLFTTDPVERRAMRRRVTSMEQAVQQSSLPVKGVLSDET